MSDPALTTGDFQAFLATVDLDTEVRTFETSTATSQMAADSIGCALGQIAKSLAFVVDEQPVLVVASGDQRVDDRKLAERFGVGRKKVKIATAELCVAVFGYAPGGVPPFGHRTSGFPVLVDNSLSRFEQLFAAGGARDAIFPISFADLVRVSGGEIVDIRRDEA